jgi:GNAT superfamily N-acetyltransferase
VRVAATTFATLFGAANFADLVAEYTAEGKIEGLPEPAVKLEKYQALEKAGRIHPFGAWNEAPSGEDRLIGFLCVMSAPSQHYDEPLACTESFFVAHDARSTGAGLALLKAAEAKARELGAGALMVSAPLGGRLEAMLPRLGYKGTSMIFTKRFDDACGTAVPHA